MRSGRIAAVLLAIAAPSLAAQAPGAAVQDSTLVDRVVAVVGDSVILMTELEAEYQLAHAQNPDTEREQVLQDLVDLQLILQEAARDSTLMPLPTEVAQRADAEIERIRQSFVDEAAFQGALSQGNLTLSAYRERIYAQTRTRLIRAGYIQRRLQNAPAAAVSEAEMRAYFEANLGDLPERPEILTLQLVLIESAASDAAWERALARADSLRSLVVEGGRDFATVAAESSDDPGAEETGGDMDWVRRGLLLPGLDRAAWALQDGSVSRPVRTDAGYHVLLVERSRPGEKRLRQILVTPDFEEEDVDRARALAEEVAERIRGGESALTFAEQYNDPRFPRELTVPRGQEAQTLPPPLGTAVAGAVEGEVLGPFDAPLEGRNFLAIARVSEVRGAGQFTFDDVREEIRQILSQQKREERMYEELRARIYVEIRL